MFIIEWGGLKCKKQFNSFWLQLFNILRPVYSCYILCSYTQIYHFNCLAMVRAKLDCWCGHLIPPHPTNNFLEQSKQVRFWWNFHSCFRWMLSQTRPNHTKPYQTKPTVKFLCYSPNKLDLNEIFAVAVDGYCLKPEQTKPYQIQLNYYASIKLQKWNRIKERKMWKNSDT